jgi:hypothetical protein
MAEYSATIILKNDINNKIRCQLHENFVAEMEWMNFLHGLQYLQTVVAQPLADLIQQEIFNISRNPVNLKLFEISRRIIENLDNLMTDSIVWQGDIRILVCFLKNFDVTSPQIRSLEHTVNQRTKLEYSVLEASLKLDKALKTSNVISSKFLEEETFKLNQIINDEGAQTLRKSILTLASKYHSKVEQHYENKNTNVSKNLLKLKCFPFLTKTKRAEIRSKSDKKWILFKDFERMEQHGVQEFINVAVPLVKHIEQSELNHGVVSQSCTDIIDLIIERIQLITSPDMDLSVFCLANLTNSIYAQLSSKSRTIFHKLFLSSITVFNSLVPDFIESEPKQISTNTAIVAIRYFGALIASENSIMSSSRLICPSVGIIWLTKALQQLYFINSDCGVSFASSYSFPEICHMIYHFLDVCGVTILKLFHAQAFEALQFIVNLQNCQGMNSENELKLLKDLVSHLLQNQKKNLVFLLSNKAIRLELSCR